MNSPPTQIVSGISSRNILDTSKIRPFSWCAGLDWTNLTRAMSSGNQIVRTWRPDYRRLNAMLYSQDQTPITIATATDSLVLQHLVASIINGVNLLEPLDQSGVYHRLISLPRQAVSSFFKALPPDIVDVIRHRLLVAAMKDGNPDTVQFLLELERGLCVSAFRPEADVHFVLDALKTCSGTVAPIIVRYASRVSRRQDLVLSQVLSIYTACKAEDRFRLRFMTLIRILVEAGASLTQSCFLLKGHNTNTLTELLHLGDRDILTWIQEGLLVTAVGGGARLYYQSDQSLLANWILSALERTFYQKAALGIWTEHDAIATCAALIRAFQAALESCWEWAIEAVYDTCYQLGYETHYSRVDLHLNNTVMQACTDRDWERAYKAVFTARSRTCAGSASVGGARSSLDTWRESQKKLQEAVLREDCRLLEELLGEDIYEHPFEILQTAIDSNCDSAAALAATYCGTEGILNLLEHGKARAISILVCQHSHWTEALQNMVPDFEYDDLEDVLYRKEPHKLCRHFPCCLSLPRPTAQQIALRVLSYHAIYKSDRTFLDWLYTHGLATESILLVQNDDMDILEIRTVSCQKGKLLNPTLPGEYDRQLPSLLEVSTQRHDANMLSYLLSRRLTYRDSDALLYAVRTKAQIATIEVLLQGGHTGATTQNAQYGSAALRVAIRDRNYELIRILAQTTDIHGLETAGYGEGCLDYLDPLGEAILRMDCTAVKILLETGGDPNAIVAFDGLQENAPRSTSNSVLSRMTALLVAIDVGGYAMAQLLVNSGAEVNRDSTMGLLRTPLQRASEIGDFKLVQYFIAQGATIDATPVYGGGTALQLAAMSGHVGIATLLIQHGADINHPPARGPGRTAFEAAAEWCRPDMMHLLVQHGAQLDLEVEEEIETSNAPEGVDLSKWYRALTWQTVRKSRTQYERALQFAEDRGEHASRRIVESLGKHLWGDMGDNLLNIVS